MADKQSEPEFEGLTDFDTFFWLLEERHGLDALKDVAGDIGLANLDARELVDLRKREDGRYNLFCRAGGKARVVVILSKDRDGKFHAEEGGFLKD